MMTTRSKAALIGVVAVLAIASLMFAYPVAAASRTSTSIGQPKDSSNTTTTTTTSTQRLPIPQPPNLVVGQTITMTSTAGVYKNLSSGQRGTASTTLTFAVTGVFDEGYALALQSGTVTLDSTTYTISAGSAQMGESQAHIVGQGSITNGGAFLFRAGAQANFWGTTFNTMRFDIEAGANEYHVHLLVTASHS